MTKGGARRRRLDFVVLCRHSFFLLWLSLLLLFLSFSLPSVVISESDLPGESDSPAESDSPSASDSLAESDSLPASDSPAESSESDSPLDESDYYDEDYYRECAPWHSNNDDDGTPPRKVLFVNLPSMQEYYGKEDNGEADFMLSHDDIGKAMEELLVMDPTSNADADATDNLFSAKAPVAYEHYMAASLDYAIRQSGFTVERITIDDRNDNLNEWLKELNMEQYHRVIMSHHVLFLWEPLIELYPHEILCRVRSIYWYGNWDSSSQEEEGDQGENDEHNGDDHDDKDENDNNENDEEAQNEKENENNGTLRNEKRKLFAERVHNKQLLTPYSESWNTFMGFFLHHLLLPPPSPEELQETLPTSSETTRAGLLLLGTSCPANQPLVVEEEGEANSLKDLIRSILTHKFDMNDNDNGDDRKEIRLDVACHEGNDRNPKDPLLFCPLFSTEEDQLAVGAPQFEGTPPARFWHMLATRQWSFALGLGRLPRLSPLPLMLLSWGVAFLNPILTTQEDDLQLFRLEHYHAPDRHKPEFAMSEGATEHNAISLLGRPYVYRVQLDKEKAEDENPHRVASSVVQAIQWSLSFPFEPFVPWEFRVDGTIVRACAMLEDNGVCQCVPNTFVTQEDSDELIPLDCKASWYVRKS